MKLPICAAITRDGTRCGRRAQPEGLLCHIHVAKAEGKPVGALTEPSPFDPKSKLLKIAAKDGHPHQLQAIKILLERDGESSCPECAARKKANQDYEVERDEEEKVIRAMTDDEYQRRRTLIAEWIASFNTYKEFMAAMRAAKKAEQ